MACKKMTNTATNHLSPRRNKNFGVEPENFNIEEFAQKCYTENAAEAVTDLVSFVTSLTPQKPLFVLYIDEARELKVSLWILLRLLGYQDRLTSMWTVLMDTKSSISYFHSPPQNSEYFSLKYQYMTIPHRNASTLFAASRRSEASDEAVYWCRLRPKCNLSRWGACGHNR